MTNDMITPSYIGLLNTKNQKQIAASIISKYSIACGIMFAVLLISCVLWLLFATTIRYLKVSIVIKELCLIRFYLNVSNNLL